MDLGHRDYGSALSLSILLSDPTTFTGGEFITYDGGDLEKPIVHAASRGDGILFHSEKRHNVRPITSGTRHSLVLELWRRETNEKNHRCG